MRYSVNKLTQSIKECPLAVSYSKHPALITKFTRTGGIFRTLSTPRPSHFHPHLIMVLLLEHSSNLMEYPTSSPSDTSISSATRLATLIAATLRGCVQAINFPLPVYPASQINYGICVVFPEPVSPTKIVVCEL